MKTYSGNHKKLSITLSSAIGLLISLIITGIGGIIGTYMIHNGSISENAYATVAFITWMVASFAGAFVSGASFKDKFLVASLLSVGVYMFLMLSIAILIFNGNLERIGQGMLAMAIGYIPTVLLNRTKSGQRKSKIRYRRR